MNGRIAWLALVATGMAQAQVPITPSYREGSDTLGQPSRIVAPDYPMTALMDARGGVVEVTGRVSPFGLLEEAKVTAVPPTDEAFAAAVRDVIGNWIFYVPTDDHCQPDPHPVTTRIEFSAEDGKPHISVLRLAAPKLEPQAHFKPIYRAEPEFPSGALNAGLGGSVFARIDVDGKGNVSDVDARAYSVRESDALRTLEKATRKALFNWRYPPPPEGKPWAGCFVVHFRFHD
jgi:outer membrane biosynthesis protein TonB